MLTYLHVLNIALIDELEVDFYDGLNILTGETGAGKSIIIGSINAVLGNKVPKDFVRSDADFALIELVFHVSNPEVCNLIRQMDIEIEDEVRISRKISGNGRSVYKVNGQVVGVNEVRNITALLIDIHSQHEHQSLLEKKNHIRLLDRYLGNRINGLLTRLKELTRQYNAYKNESKDFTLDESLRKREIDFLEYEIDELESANLSPGEDEELQSIFKKQSNIHAISQDLSEINSIVSESNFSVSYGISKALEKLNHAKNMDSDLNDLFEQLLQIEGLLNDFNHDLINYADDLVVDEALLEETHKRIDLINQLKNKHGNTIEEILQKLQEKKERLERLKSSEERLITINKEMEKLEAEILKLCDEISEVRKEGAVVLAKEILEALKTLNLQNSSFEIRVEPKANFTSDGKDEVEFMISTNVGENVKPLTQIASGGELSRVMLALKSVLADCDDVGTLIFDEIDTGISGRTAQMVAEKMAQLSRTRQIICITHLPQIAAMADHHYLIDKEVSKNRTVTNMKKLKEDEMPNELARLLGGAVITDTVLTGAIEMKQLANQIKSSK